MLFGRPKSERAAHREASYDNFVRARTEIPIGGVDRGGPIAPLILGHVLGSRSVTRQPGKFHRETGGRKRLRKRPHGLRASGKPVDDQRASAVALRRIGFRSWHNCRFVAHSVSSASCSIN